MNVKVPQSGSLEEQRDALLARIHTSRAAYREQMHAVDAGAPTPTMKQLMHELVKLRCRPYYLYNCDLSEGLAHFRTPGGVSISSNSTRPEWIGKAVCRER